MIRSVIVSLKLALPAMVFLMMVSPAIASAQQTSSPRESAGCGPAETQFDVKTDKSLHTISQPDSGKALIYIVEQEKVNDELRIGAVTTRVGLDGKWIGANHGASYFFVAVDPGEHHLCSDWQSVFKRLSKQGSAMTINAEAGKIYFVRVEVEERKDRPPAINIELVDTAQGQFMISASALSSPREKPKTQASN